MKYKIEVCTKKVLILQTTEIGWLNTARAELRETKGRTAGR